MYKYLTYLLILIISMNGYTDFKNLGPDDVLTTPLPLPYNEKVVKTSELDNFIDTSIQKGKQPVIIFGGNWCPDCRILDGTLDIPTIKKFMQQYYQVMHIDIGRYDKNRKPIRSISLTSDTAVLTCIANDFGYDEIFARQLDGLGKPGDTLVAISTSGKSQNVINAIKQAKYMKINTIGLLGKSGGETLPLCDDVIVVPSQTTARVQEMHIFFGHILCDLIEEGLGLK